MRIGLGLKAGRVRGRIRGSSVTGFVWDGDSIARGYGLATSEQPPSVLATITGLEAVNLGVDSKTLQATNADYATLTAPQYSAESRNTLILTSGINDLFFGLTATDIQTYVQQYCGKARATGFKVYVCSIMSNGVIDATAETNRQNYNTWLRSNYASFCDGLVDYAAAPEFDDYNDLTYFQSDDRHPNALGAAIMAQMVASATHVPATAIEAPPAGTATLSAGDKDSRITLSGGNLTATKVLDNTYQWVSVRSTNSHTAGRRYYEAQLSQVAGSYVAAGFANASASLGTYTGADANGVCLATDGNTYKGGSATASGLGAVTAGHWAGLDIDIDARQYRVRNISTASAWTGWIALPAGMSTGAVFAAVGVQYHGSFDVGDQVTVNFGGSAFLGEVPAGASAWGA